MNLNKWTWIASAALGCAVVVGCSDDTKSSSGTSGTSGASGMTGTSGGMTGTSGTSGGMTGTSGTSGGMTDSLYNRLGKKDGITKAVDAIVAAELANAEIASYFAVTANGNPTAAQVKECLVNQLGVAAGGPASEVKYPTTVTGDYMCRDMAKSHAELGIPNGVFGNFIAIAAGVLKTAGVADKDIETIGTVLTGMKSDIVKDTMRDGGNFQGDAAGNNQR